MYWCVVGFFFLGFSVTFCTSDVCGVQLHQNVENINLIGLVPDKYRSFGFMAFELIQFVVQEVNVNVLENITKLGLEIFSICEDDRVDAITEIFTEFILNTHDKSSCTCKKNEENVHHIGVVESLTSTLTRHLSNILSFTEIPIVSNIATTTSLSNKNSYPNFFRTIPSDSVFAQALVDFVLMYNWSFVSVMATEDWYGFDGKYVLESFFEKNSICIDLDILLHVPIHKDDFYSIFQKLKSRHLNAIPTSVVIIYAIGSTAKEILMLAEEQGLHGITWIICDGAEVSNWYTDIDPKIMSGVFAFGHFGGLYPEFSNYFGALFQTQNKSLELKRYISFYNISTVEEFTSSFSSTMPYIGFIRNSVYSYALALRNYFNDVCDGHNATTCMFLHTFNQTKFLKNFLPHVSFVGLQNETVKFDQNGEVNTSVFYLYNFQPKNGVVDMVKVGEWNSIAGLQIQRDIVWVSGLSGPPLSSCSKTCNPGFYPIVNVGKTCCWICVECKLGHVKPLPGNDMCVPCKDGWRNKNNTACIWFNLLKYSDFPTFLYTSYVLTTCGALVSLLVCFTIIKFRATPIMKACNWKLSCVQVCMQFILFCTLNLMLYDGNVVFCVAVFFTNGWLIVLVISMMLVKAEQLVQIFKSNIRISAEDMLMLKAISWAILISTSLIEICFTAGLLLFESSKVETIYYVRDFTKEHSCDLQSYVVVQSLYVVVLSIVCGVEAFRCRKLPFRYNDSRAIMYTMILMLFFVVLAIPLRSSAPNIYVRSFILYLVTYCANMSNLCIGYWYKVYIAWLKPVENTLVAFQTSVFLDTIKVVDKQIAYKQEEAYKMRRYAHTV